MVGTSALSTGLTGLKFKRGLVIYMWTVWTAPLLHLVYGTGLTGLKFKRGLVIYLWTVWTAPLLHLVYGESGQVHLLLQPQLLQYILHQ